MDYVNEARKFIQRAADADHPDVVKEHLRIADWCLGQEIEERVDPPEPENGAKAKPS